MNTAANEEYWSQAGRDRRRSRGRRAEDLHTCSFHETTCGDVEELKKTTLPRWVFIWIGGPVVGATLMFTSWTAIKGIGTAEHLIKVEAESAAKMEAMSHNISELMKHFNLTPIEPRIR